MVMNGSDVFCLLSGLLCKAGLVFLLTAGQFVKTGNRRSCADLHASVFGSAMIATVGKSDVCLSLSSKHNTYKTGL